MIARNTATKSKNKRKPLRSSGGNGSPQRDRKLVIVRAPGKYTSLGYRSARIASSEGRVYSAASGEQHERYDRLKLINQSRTFLRNNSIYKGMINRAVSYIVGNGFTLQMKTKNKGFNAKAEALWERFHSRPEIRGILSGRKTDRMTCQELLVAGDTAVILTNKDGKIQLIEAEQIAAKSRIIDGIKKDEFGAPVKFWICPYNKNGFAATAKAKGYNPENILFLTNPERPSSVRGVPPCQSAFPMLHRINDVCDSEAIAWQLLARLAVSINRKEGAQQAYNESKADPDKEGTAGEGSLSTRITELDYALMFQADVGEEIKGIERNIPGKNFSESLRMFLRLLGLPLGLPLEIILLDWTKSNYSQSRAVLEQAYQVFLDYQAILEDYYYRPLIEWKIQQWIDAKELGDSKEKFKFDLIKPTFPWIDQLKEVEAYGKKVSRGFTTHTQVCKSLNADREDIVDLREAEIKDAIERVKKIKDETGFEVPYEILCGLEVSGAAKKLLESESEEQPAGKKNKNENE